MKFLRAPGQLHEKGSQCYWIWLSNSTHSRRKHFNHELLSHLYQIAIWTSPERFKKARCLMVTIQLLLQNTFLIFFAFIEYASLSQNCASTITVSSYIHICELHLCPCSEHMGNKAPFYSHSEYQSTQSDSSYVLLVLKKPGIHTKLFLNPKLNITASSLR